MSDTAHDSIGISRLQFEVDSLLKLRKPLISESRQLGFRMMAAALPAESCCSAAVEPEGSKSDDCAPQLVLLLVTRELPIEYNAVLIYKVVWARLTTICQLSLLLVRKLLLGTETRQNPLCLKR